MYQRNIDTKKLIILEEGDILEGTNGNTYVVKAGINLKCDHKVHKADNNGIPNCPPHINTTDFIISANKILNKVGVTFIDKGTKDIFENYNFIKEDDIMDKYEQYYLHINTLFSSGNPKNPYVFIVENLGTGVFGGKVLGRATSGINTNTMALINGAYSEVLAHEMGHAIWNLEHPGCPCGIVNNKYYNGQFGIDDYYNFMNGTANLTKEWNVRRYQFNVIHR